MTSGAFFCRDGRAVAARRSDAAAESDRIAGHTIRINGIELSLSELEVGGENDTKMEMKGGITVIAIPMSAPS